MSRARVCYHGSTLVSHLLYSFIVFKACFIECVTFFLRCSALLSIWRLPSFITDSEMFLASFSEGLQLYCCPKSSYKSTYIVALMRMKVLRQSD